jgi:hypothetical protein
VTNTIWKSENSICKTLTWAIKSQNIGMSTKRSWARERTSLRAVMNWPCSSSCLVTWRRRNRMGFDTCAWCIMQALV